MQAEQDDKSEQFIPEKHLGLDTLEEVLNNIIDGTYTIGEITYWDFPVAFVNHWAINLHRVDVETVKQFLEKLGTTEQRAWNTDEEKDMFNVVTSLFMNSLYSTQVTIAEYKDGNGDVFRTYSFGETTSKRFYLKGR